MLSSFSAHAFHDLSHHIDRVTWNSVSAVVVNDIEESVFRALHSARGFGEIEAQFCLDVPSAVRTRAAAHQLQTALAYGVAARDQHVRYICIQADGALQSVGGALHIMHCVGQLFSVPSLSSL